LWLLRALYNAAQCSALPAVSRTCCISFSFVSTVPTSLVIADVWSGWRGCEARHLCNASYTLIYRHSNWCGRCCSRDRGTVAQRPAGCFLSSGRVLLVRRKKCKRSLRSMNGGLNSGFKPTICLEGLFSFSCWVHHPADLVCTSVTVFYADA